MNTKKLSLLLLVFASFISHSIFAGGLSGTYTIDPSKAISSTNFTTIQSALHYLDSLGTSGNVTFKIADGTYKGPFFVSGYGTTRYSDTLPVTFTSISGDSSKVILEYSKKMQPTFNISDCANLNFTYLSFRSDSAMAINLEFGVNNNIAFVGCSIDSMSYSAAASIHLDKCYFKNGIISRSGLINSTITNCIFKSEYYNSSSGEIFDNIFISNNIFEGYMEFVMDNPTYVQYVYITGNIFKKNVLVTDADRFAYNKIYGEAQLGGELNEGVAINNFFYKSLNSYAWDINSNTIVDTMTFRIDSYRHGSGNSVKNNIIGKCLVVEDGSDLWYTNGSDAITIVTNGFSNNCYKKPSFNYAQTNNTNGYSGLGTSSIKTWQDSTQADSNSIVADPLYKNSIDLTPTYFALDGAGIADTMVKDDIYHKKRASKQDIGAVEFTGSVFKLDSLKGTLKLSSGSAEGSTTIYLVKFNAADTTISSADSCITDINGQYAFINNDTTTPFYLYAKPSTSYASELPTWYDTTTFYQNSTSIHMKTGKTQVINFSTLSGKNPGGKGFIGGKVLKCAGACKVSDGAPVAKLKVILYDVKGKPQAIAYTDKNGYFSFSNLSIQSYKIYVDYPYVNNKVAPVINLTSSKKQDSIKFLLHPTFLEMKNTITTVEEEIPANFQSIHIVPNPFSESANISLTLEKASDVKIELYDMKGTQTLNIYKTNLEAGEFNFPIEKANCPNPGIYIIRVITRDGIYTQRIMRTTF